VATPTPLIRPQRSSPDNFYCAWSQLPSRYPLKGDTSFLDGVLADDFVVINPAGEVETRAEFLKALKDGTLHFDAIERSEVKVRTYGDAAVLTAHAQVKVTYKGRSGSGSVRTSQFYIKQEGKWRCVSAQATPIAAQSGGSGDKP
jgi:ketosteroid isomerase-like protein